MGPLIALTVSAVCGGLLVLTAAALLAAFPRLPAVWNWAWSWFLAAAGCLLTVFWPFLAADMTGLWEQVFQTALVLGSNLALALGFLNWFKVSPDRGKGALARTLLWGGTVLSSVLTAVGLSGSELWAWLLTAGWSLVPVLASFGLLALFGLSQSRGAVRAQSLALVWALGFGMVPYVLSWVVLPLFPGAGWSLGFPPFLVLGAGLTFRALVRFDTRFHHRQAASFLLQKTQDTVVFLQADGRLQAVNPAVRVLLDTEEAHLVGKTLTSLGADTGSCSLLAALEALTYTDWEGTLNLVHRTGRPVPVHVVYRRIHNPAREAVGAVLLLYDMRLPRQLDLTSREDLLTALSNRRWVLELLEAEFQRVLRYGGPLSAFWVEVDHLDQVEAREGKEGADEVLRKVASVLRSCLRKTDFCGRVGLREFLAVLPETSRDRAEVVVGRLGTMFALSVEEGAPETALRVGLADLDAATVSADDFVARVRAAIPPAGSPV